VSRTPDHGVSRKVGQSLFCDPDTETLYGQHVTAERINYTPNNWTIVIPRDQTITLDAKDAIAAIAYAALGATEDPLDETMPYLPPFWPN
jgi:hypothetical protein